MMTELLYMRIRGKLGISRGSLMENKNEREGQERDEWKKKLITGRFHSSSFWNYYYYY